MNLSDIYQAFFIFIALLITDDILENKSLIVPTKFIAGN